MRIPFLGGIGVPELIIILIVVLLIFGPKNLPKLGNAIGRTFKSMRDGMDGKKKDDSAVEAQEAPAAEAAEAPAKETPKVDETVEEVIIEEGAPAQAQEAPAQKAE